MVADKVTKARLVPEWMEKDKTQETENPDNEQFGLYIAHQANTTYGDQERIDIRSLLPAIEFFQNKLEIGNSVGKIGFEISKSEANNSGDNGVILLYNLVHGNKKYLYDVCSNVSYHITNMLNAPEYGDTNFDDTNNNQLENISETEKYDPSLPENRNKPFYKPMEWNRMRVDGHLAIAYALGKEAVNNFEGSRLFLDKACTQIAPRAGIVFHELWENWERTQNGKYYPEAHAAAKKAGRNFTDNRKTVDVYYNKHAQ